MSDVKQVTLAEIEAIEAYCDAMTPGPWEWSGPTDNEQRRGVYRTYVHRQVGCGDVPPEKFFISIQSVGIPERDDADGFGIAKARTDLPRLCAELKRFTPNPSSTVGAQDELDMSEVARRVTLRAEDYSAGVAAERQRIREAVEKMTISEDFPSLCQTGYYMAHDDVLAIIDSTTEASGEKGTRSRIKILVRKNLKMSSGKLAAQSVHAALALACLEELDPMMSVVVLEVNGKPFDDAKAERAGRIAIVRDAGYTEVAPGTETCIAFLEEDPRFAPQAAAEEEVK